MQRSSDRRAPLPGFDVQAYHHEMVRLVHARRDLLSLDGPLEDVRFHFLGAGESNVNFRMTVDGAHNFTVRVARRLETEASLIREFNLLRFLPAGFGPQPFLLDASREWLPHPFAILSYLHGSPVQRPSIAHLRTHAARLAQLHTHQVSFWGDPDRVQNRPFNIHDHFNSAVQYWRTAHPWVLEVESVSRLLPLLDEYFNAHASLFTRLSSFSIIHGDACLPNILFDAENVCYIDWEWMSFGDPVLDLAPLCWDIENLPWNSALRPEDREAYLTAYLAHRPDDTLRERLPVWITFIKFTDHLHYRTKAACAELTIHDLPREVYHDAVINIERSLVAQFL